MSKLHHRLNAVVYPAPDFPGKWVAHVLELDIVTQGDSINHALEMLDDALRVVAYENLSHGLPPFEFRSAPPEDWRRLQGAEPISTHILHIEGQPFSDDVEINSSVRGAG